MIGVGAGGPTGAWATSAEPSPALAGEPVTPAAGALGRPARLTERQAWAVLTSVDGLGPVGFGALLAAFGSGRAVLEAALRPGATRRLVEAGVVDERESFDATTAGAIAAVAEDPRAVLRRIEIPGVEILTTEDAAYPSRLLSIELPPHVLFVRGDRSRPWPRATRSPSSGRAGRPRPAGRPPGGSAASLAKAGAVVVSGLAVGIDGASHAAAMAEGAPTVAVLGSGHGRLYPRAHAKLAERDRRRRRRGRLGVRAREAAQRLHVPAAEPPDQRSRRRDGRRRGRRRGAAR